MSYDQELKYKWDNENALAYREELGFEKGIEQGKKGEAITIALKMKEGGLPLEEIAIYTKLPIEEVVAL